METTAFPTIRTPSGAVSAGAPRWNRQRHSRMPSHRYPSVFDRVEVPLVERDWPGRRFVAAPLWVPVDLRDGNQALAEPMDPERKRRFFELMVAMGYKEIEVGYPSASDTDYSFVRLLAESDLAPVDVTVVVFTPARRDLIERTVESIRGIDNDVVIHMYAATAPTWRQTVLGHDRTSLLELILAGARDIRELAGDLGNVRFEFSPEVYNLTEPDYILEVCDAVTGLWEASPDRPVILNLPATVEVATPNVYADQIEYTHKHLARRDSVILSVHPHNDRGTGVACAELAMLAGAQRVEGCILGNGERTGNVDLAILALNLHAQGIDPMIDFSDIGEVRRTVEYCNRIETHPRHPYVGDLVHTAFSGTHQDAIRKGFAEHRDRAIQTGTPESTLDWRVPYLPIDPADLGRRYDAVIRVNSQSGKGGIAYLLETEYRCSLPRRLEIDFASHVQAHTDSTGTEVSARDLMALFERTYLAPSLSPGTVELVALESTIRGDVTLMNVTMRIRGTAVTVSFEEERQVDAITAVLAEHNVPVEIVSLHHTSLKTSNGSDWLALLEFRADSSVHWAAGRDRDMFTATLNAVVKAASSLTNGSASSEPEVGATLLR